VGGKTTESAALNLAVNGFTVFPIEAGKKAPPLVRFTQTASSDPNEVAELWHQHPDANIGVVPGGGTIVLDTDSAEAARFIDELGMPETTTAKTPRGGNHFYLLGSAPTRAGVRPGLDIRGRGGYAVGPGSVVNGRRYEWVVPPWEVPPQPAPKAVLELVKERAKFRALDRRSILHGRRNETLTRIAGWFVGQGIQGEPLRVAVHAVNAERCKPPLSDQEVEGIVKSANKWDEPPLWLVDPFRFAEDPNLSGPARHVLAVFAARAQVDGTVRGGDWVAELIGKDRRAVYRAVDELEQSKRLRVKRYRSPGKANDYKLLPFEPLTPCTTGKGVPKHDTGETAT
jgi:Bifunctional DNA primase/polymerase, N-terminal/Primase C terminal 1 (PriCT-1)